MLAMSAGIESENAWWNVRDAVEYKCMIAKMRVPKKYNVGEAARIMRGGAVRGDIGDYQTAGIAKANIWPCGGVSVLIRSIAIG